MFYREKGAAHHRAQNTASGGLERPHTGYRIHQSSDRRGDIEEDTTAGPI